MPDTEKMLAAMRAEPDREWTRAELAELRGTELVPTGTALGKLKREGTIESAGRGLYRWAGEKEEAAPKAKKAKPAKKSTPAKKATPKHARSAAQEETSEETGAPSKVEKLNWLVDGLEGGFLDQAAFIEQVKALVQS